MLWDHLCLYSWPHDCRVGMTSLILSRVLWEKGLLYYDGTYTGTVPIVRCLLYWDGSYTVPASCLSSPPDLSRPVFNNISNNIPL